MTDAELRAAAERMRTYRAAGWKLPQSAYSLGGGKADVRQMTADVALLLEDWLDSHPADDAEQWSAEWLVAVGFASDGADPPDYWSPWSVPPGGGPIARLCCRPWMGCDAWSVEDATITPPETKGDVRRLAAALNIPLAVARAP